MLQILTKLRYRTDAKLFSTILFVSLANYLFFDSPIGSTIGLFCLILLLGISFFQPEIHRQSKTRLILLSAVLIAASMIEAANIYQFALFLFLAFALVILPKLRDKLPLPAFLLLGLKLASILWFRVGRDLSKMAKISVNKGTSFSDLKKLFGTLALPLTAGAIFTYLFYIANPILEKLFNEVTFPDIWYFITFERLVFSFITLSSIWFLFRPRIKLGMLRGKAEKHVETKTPIFDYFFNQSAIWGSLIIFNILFTGQNLSDIAFLWSGNNLPEGMNYAQYAHRGAYPLIFTALMSGIFVLLSQKNASQHSTILIYVWVFQNIFLVASSLLRTIRYIETYSLTHLRVAALIWMALVAVGLGLIILKISFKKSGQWLIDLNMSSLLATLIVCSFINFGAIIANFNITHCYETTGKGAKLDMAYLSSLGVDALPAMIMLKDRLAIDTPHIELLSRLNNEITNSKQYLETNVSDWRSFTLRNYRLSRTLK